MMTIKTCNPKNAERGFGFLSNPANLDNLFGQFFAGTELESKTAKVPAVNIKKDEKEIVLELMAPGFEKEEIKINLEENILTVAGEKKTETKEENETYTRREFTAASFSRSFSLPENVNSEEIKAEFKNGILFVSIPKKAEEKKEAKSISIA
jgi:HSP20 family protein